MKTRNKKVKAVFEDAKSRAAISGWFSGTTEAIRIMDPTDEQLDQMMALFAGWCVDLTGSEARGAVAVCSLINIFLDYEEEDDNFGGVRERLQDWLQRHAVVEDGDDMLEACSRPNSLVFLDGSPRVV